MFPVEDRRMASEIPSSPPPSAFRLPPSPRPAPRILMCPPDHYGIEYEINPWMNRSLGAASATSPSASGGSSTRRSSTSASRSRR